jgi:hypothetical protein
MKNFFAVVGIVGTVALIVACGVIALLVGNLLLDVNRAPVVLETAVQTLAPISPEMTVEPPGVIILSTSTPFPTAVPATTATQPPASPPAPTRPAIDRLPLGEGPYTLEQAQICRDVWTQSLQGELTVHQFGYCQGVVSR